MKNSHLISKFSKSLSNLEFFGATLQNSCEFCKACPHPKSVKAAYLDATVLWGIAGSPKNSRIRRDFYKNKTPYRVRTFLYGICSGPREFHLTMTGMIFLGSPVISTSSSKGFFIA